MINCKVILLLKHFRNLESEFSICSGISGILNQNLEFMSVVSFPVQEGRGTLLHWFLYARNTGLG